MFGVCMCVCVCACARMCACMCMYVCVCACVHMHVCIIIHLPLHRFLVIASVPFYEQSWLSIYNFILYISISISISISNSRQDDIIKIKIWAWATIWQGIVLMDLMVAWKSPASKSMKHDHASFISLQLVSNPVHPLQRHDRKLHGLCYDFHIELQYRFQD